MSIIIFQSHPIQYLSPLYKEMAQSIEMEVVYYSDTSIKPTLDKGFGKKIQWDIPLLEGYRHSFLKNFSLSKSMDCKWYNAINFSVIRKVKHSTNQVLLINGWSYFTDWLVILSAKLYGNEVWVRADNPLSQEKKSGWKFLLKKYVLRKILFPCIDKFLYVGKESKAFFEFYGAKPAALLYTPHAVNNNYFYQQAAQFSSNRNAFRNNLNIPLDSFVFLVTAKFIKEKNHFDVLHAFEKIIDSKFFLIFVGDGPFKDKIDNYIQSKKIKNILLTGFVNQSELYKYYLISDCFILPSSSETWGLVVNEAMNFGLPLIVSSACGCATELVEEGVNGLVYPAGDVGSLRNAMQRLLSDKQFASTAGKISLKIIQQFSFQTITKQIKKHLN